MLLWAKILVKAEGRERPSIVNILSGSRRYELHIRWELPPWVAGVFPSKGVDTGLQNQEGDEWSKRAAQGACSGRKQSINDGLKRTSGVRNGKSGWGLFNHTKSERGTTAQDPRMGCDPIVEGYRCKGSDSPKGRIRLDSGLEAVSDGLSPSAHQITLKPKDMGSLKGSGSKAHVSGLGRLEEAGSSLNIKPRALVGLSYNRREEKECVLALSNTGDELADLRYDHSQFLPSTSSPFVSDRLHPSEEFFGQGGGCEKFRGYAANK